MTKNTSKMPQSRRTAFKCIIRIRDAKQIMKKQMRTATEEPPWNSHRGRGGWVLKPVLLTLNSIIIFFIIII